MQATLMFVPGHGQRLVTQVFPSGVPLPSDDEFEGTFAVSADGTAYLLAPKAWDSAKAAAGGYDDFKGRVRPGQLGRRRAR